MRRFMLSLVLGAVVLGAATPVRSDSDAAQLAGQIETRVRRAIGAARPSRQAESVVRFERFAVRADCGPIQSWLFVLRCCFARSSSIRLA